MRLLVLWNTAGVLSPVVKWMNKNGHEARIVMRRSLDGFGHSEETGSAIMVDTAKEFYKEGISQFNSFKPDIVHINTQIRMLLHIRLRSLSVPIVFQYNGSDVRGRHNAHSQTQLADIVLVSSQDLKQYGQWMDRPIDDMFHYRGGRRPNTALGIYADYWLRDTRHEMAQWCNARGADFHLLDRTSPDFQAIPYQKMPEFLSRFESFLDFKGHGKEQFALSKTALEALACGCKVFHDANPNTIIQGYEFKTPEQYYELYAALLREKPSLYGLMVRVVKLLGSILLEGRALRKRRRGV